MKSVIEKDFKEQFAKSGEVVRVSDQYIASRIVFETSDCSFKSATIRNCEFEDNVVFNVVDFKQGIRFIDCKFARGLLLYDCSAEGFDESLVFQLGNVIIEKGSIANLVIHGNKIIDRGLRIEEGTKIATVSVKGLKTKSDGSGVHLENIEITQKLDIENWEISGNFTIQNCLISGWVRSWDIHAASVVLQKTIFHDNVNFSAGKLKSLSMSDNEFKDDVFISGASISNILTTKNDEFQRSFQIDYEDETNNLRAGPTNYHIENTRLNNGMVVNGSNFNIVAIDMIFSPSMSGTFKFNSCIIENVSISGDNMNASLLFNYCQFGELKFNHFYNHSSLTLSSCKATDRSDSSFMLYNTTLGKASLLNFFFNSFSKVEIHDSIFVDMNVSGVEWFEDHKLSINPDAGIDLVKKREVYRQLKQVCERNGDKIQALSFRAKELSLFYQSMIQRRVPFFKGDRLTLWLSQSNNFGLDWIKATAILILVTIVFFPIIVIAASPGFLLIPSRNPVHVFLTVLELWNHIEVLPQLFNPTRILSRLFPTTELGFSAHFFDTIHRLILAYLIVQIIAAFRKYIR